MRAINRNSMNSNVIIWIYSKNSFRTHRSFSLMIFSQIDTKSDSICAWQFSHRQYIISALVGWNMLVVIGSLIMTQWIICFSFSLIIFSTFENFTQKKTKVFVYYYWLNKWKISRSFPVDGIKSGKIFCSRKKRRGNKEKSLFCSERNRTQRSQKNESH